MEICYRVEEDDVEKRLGKYQVALRFLAAPINPADLNMVYRQINYI